MKLKNLLDEAKKLKQEIKNVDLKQKEELIWNVMTMKISQESYLSLKKKHYQQNNNKLLENLKKCKKEIELKSKLFSEKEQQRKFLEEEIESLKKIQKLKEDFFGVLWKCSQNNKQSYREKILRDNLNEKQEGKQYINIIKYI